MDQQGQRIDAVVGRFQGRLLSYALRIVGNADCAADVVQETFAKLCQAPAVADNGHLTEWLYRVCRNQALDVRRKDKRLRPMIETAEDIFISPGETPDATAERKEAHGGLLAALEHLPGNQQEVIRLKFQHGMSYRQIAEITGHSESNVGFLMHVGIKTLRKQLMSPISS